MNEQRIQDYLKLIQTLLNCPNGKQVEILHHHSNLVDEGLVRMMEWVAEEMVKEGNTNGEWLREFAAKLAKPIESWQQLNQQVIQLYNQSQYTQAVSLAEAALVLAQQLWGNDHPHIASSLNNLAELYRSKRRLGEAEPLYQQALAMRQRLFAHDHPDVASSLNNLGLLYHFQGRLPEAEPLYQRAMEMRQRLFAHDHPDVASSLNNLGGLYESQGKLTEAEPLLKQALAMRQRLFANDHPDVGLSLNNLGLLYQSQGKLTEAEPLLKQALAMRQYLFAGDHPDVASSLNNLGLLYQSQGKLAEAEPLYQQTLAMRQRLFSDDHPDVATSLNNLGLLYQSQGKLAEAEPLLQQAMEMFQRLFSDDHPDVATSLNNLGGLYQSQGKLAEAEPLLQQAMEMFQRLFSDDHPDVASSLNNLGGLYQSQGKLAEAEPLYQQAMEMFQRLFSDDHPDVASSLNNLGELYQSQGKLGEVEPLLQQALAMFQRLFADNHPHVGLSLNNLGGLYQSQGKLGEAEPLYQQALAMFQRLFAGDHPHVALSLNNLAVLFAATHRYDQALNYMKQAMAIENRLIHQAFTYSCESDRLAFLQQIRHNFDVFLSLIYQHFPNSPHAIQTALDLILQRKCLTATASAALNQAIHSGRYPHLQSEFTKLRQLSDQIIHYFYHEPRPDLIPQLQREQNQLQKQLTAQVPEIQLQDQPIDCHTVALALPEGSSLIEFVCFDVFDFHASHIKPARYLAFILPAGQPDNVQMRYLGAAQEINQLIQDFRHDVSDQVKAVQSLDMGGDDEEDEADEQPQPINGIELQHRIFAPLRPDLQPNQPLFLAPDGDLNLLPFDLLPSDETGETLLRDEYAISYLSGGRDILRSKIQTNRPSSPPLIIADPDFDLVAPVEAGLTDNIAIETPVGAGLADNIASTPPTSQQNPPSVFPNEQNSIATLLQTLANFSFQRAEGTRHLGESIAQRFNISPYFGKDALASHLTQCQSPELLLIATHGYFSKSIQTPSTSHPEDPMLRSALAFAGANRWLEGKPLPDAAEKGMVFAQDIAALDLWETELAILSACQTGIGDVKLGEGVFGLRRAFAIAGTKTLIMSLWSVPDRATALLMNRFLSNLRQGIGRRVALKEAQDYIRTIMVKQLQESELGCSILAELEKELPQTRQLHPTAQALAHPYFWGAWVCQGETKAVKLNRL
ncbi:Tetratricopeptide repeat family [Coleofasciculus chthonoplastes PCC 7420]|uniref:Tetratricopeptide repeat family n=1 Tax=Coleofasciculus chthonoplastes PCC 7420 TaxID=118168 RepID=B4VUQ2_9CYAN|nr:tetratricopeptide repeat protein [Coleofasciculus chthonoplastes]EDX74377.1 Tetratricopeptide repeat family [Coleofasciculus chthonoplastes PCC 7420]